VEAAKEVVARRGKLTKSQVWKGRRPPDWRGHEESGYCQEETQSCHLMLKGAINPRTNMSRP